MAVRTGWRVPIDFLVMVVNFTLIVTAETRPGYSRLRMTNRTYAAGPIMIDWEGMILPPTRG